MIKYLTLSMLATAALFAGSPSAHASGERLRHQHEHRSAHVDCHLRYTLKGWSAIYKHASGSGTIQCDNGERANVRIRVNGGGLTAGKWRIDDGRGEISDVRDIRNVFGSYASVNADVGVVKSAGAQVLTKGPVSLALSGVGRGINLGIDVGKFTISRVR